MENIGKQVWRREISRRRAALAPQDFIRANSRIQQRFFNLNPVREAGVVMIYHSINGEVATEGLIEKLIRLGKQVALPVCIPGPDLEARAIQSLAEVVPTGRFGLREPSAETPLVDPATIDLIVIPGVAFDIHGNRLGHGMGYYDRFLSRSGLRGFKLGLAYDFQVVDGLPVETYDVRMDALLTPELYLNFT